MLRVCGSGSALILGSWTRIRIRIHIREKTGSVSGSKLKRNVGSFKKAQKEAMEGRGRSQRRSGRSPNQCSQICTILMRSKVRIRNRTPVKRGTRIRMLDVMLNVKSNSNACYVPTSKSREHIGFAWDEIPM